MVCVRELYRKGELSEIELSNASLENYIPVFDVIFDKYADNDSWSLSDLTHTETSWLNARKGCTTDENCNVRLKIEDIYEDAERIKLRRFYVKEILPRLNAKHE